ncbi:MAG: hypothetical protein WD768_04940 [Phycisphaeraceae bacterium]
MPNTAPNQELLTGLHCPGCDYDLSGTWEFSCPECGKTFTREELERRADRPYPGVTVFVVYVLMLITLVSIGRIEVVNFAAGDPISSYSREIDGPWRVGVRRLPSSFDKVYLTLHSTGCASIMAAPLLLAFSVVLLLIHRGWRDARLAAWVGLAVALAAIARAWFFYAPILID